MVLKIENLPTLKSCTHHSTIPVNRALANTYVAVPKFCSISNLFLVEVHILIKIF